MMGWPIRWMWLGWPYNVRLFPHIRWIILYLVNVKYLEFLFLILGDDEVNNNRSSATPELLPPIELCINTRYGIINTRYGIIISLQICTWHVTAFTLHLSFLQHKKTMGLMQGWGKTVHFLSVINNLCPQPTIVGIFFFVGGEVPLNGMEQRNCYRTTEVIQNQCTMCRRRWTKMTPSQNAVSFCIIIYLYNVGYLYCMWGLINSCIQYVRFISKFD